MGTKYKHLSASERDAIHRGRLQGLKPAAIAESLGRPRSTVSRELSRNGGAEAYDAPAAQRRYRQGRRRGGRKLAPGTPLWEPVAMDLLRGWSPQQIHGRGAARADTVGTGAAASRPWPRSASGP